MKETQSAENHPSIQLGQLEGLMVSCPGKRPGQEEVASMLRKMQQNAAKKVPPDGGARDGDDLIVDFTAEKDGVPLRDVVGEEVPLHLGDGAFLPAFEEPLHGMCVGETRTMEVLFPAHYPMKSLAGQRAVFHVTLRECTRTVVPPLDDDFAREIGGMESLETLKAAIGEELNRLFDIKRKNLLRSQLIRQAVDNASAEISPVDIEAEIELTLQTFTEKLEAEGMTLDDYMDKTGLQYDAVREDLRREAVDSLKTTLVLQEIARQKHLVPSSKAVEKGLADLANAIQCSVGEFRERYPMAVSEIEDSLRMELAIDYLYRSADIRE